MWTWWVNRSSSAPVSRSEPKISVHSLKGRFEVTSVDACSSRWEKISKSSSAAFQPQWVASPESELGRYLGLWLAVAAISLIVAGAEMAWRARNAGPGLARDRTLLAVEQFLPSVIVGALLTLSIYRGAPPVAWMLPGLWSLVFGLGVFASYRLLPRQVFSVGCYYVLSGCGCLLWGQGDNAFSP